METYEGPVDSIYRIQDVESEPIEHLVTVYHSGRSDEFVPMEEKKPSVDVGEVFTDAAQALGAKITGLFKRGPAHLDYPTSGPYDGPLASTSLAWDVEGEPLQQHVSVYHSGRSDEPMTKIVEIPTEISLEEVPVVEKPTVTAKIITGLFKKDETYLDYPAMETYEGPVDSIYRIQDVESEPIEHLVTVYHSGRSDEFVPMEEKKPSVDVGEVFTDAAQALGAKITGLFKRGPAHLDYPTSGPYDGPLASTSLAWDVEGEPLQQHVSVYHSGRSDEPMTKIVEIPTEISLEEVPVVEKPTVTAKIITGLFKKDETYLDYPAMETYEGPVDSIYRIQDVESEPIEHLVTVYHSGRSDEFVPMEEKKPSVDVGEVFTDAAQALGAKITGLFKRGPAHLDYPTSGPYDGPLASTSLAWDVEGEPLQQHVSVYHSGRSDEPMTKIVEIPTEISLEEVPVVEKPTVTAKIITGLFKKDETYLDYPAMETYEGPVDSIYRIQDVESEPIEHLVTVYHSGRSDEFVPMEEKKPSVDVGEVFTDAAQALGAKITGLFKRGPAHLDYPTSGPYDGPLASTSLAWDVEGEPLQQHVSVYHSGRSDEPMTKIVEIPTEISLEEVPVVEKPTVTAKIITGLFKKDETYLDYPAMETYEGPVDSIYRIQDVESEPIEHLVTVYHSGRSDEFVPMEEKKPSVDVGEVFTDAAQALGAKITGLFKRGPAHLDYPTSGPYDGPLASTSLAWDVEGEPLQQHVSVYHSGRSDEPMTKIVEIPTEISLEEVPVVEKPTVTAKIITGLFKKDETYLDYPAMETYEGPVDSIYRIQDVESEPIEHLVTVYHSGRSDEFVPMEEKKPSVDVGEVFTDAAQALGAKITGLFKRGPAHLDYPTSGPYDGPLASTSLAWDVEGEPLQQHVSVYHSGRSDEPMTKIVEIPTEISLEEVPVVEKPTVTAKIITGLFKKDETYLDYPAMETYEGPVDSIYRIQDVESEPIEHLVTVYHSGRSDEFVPMEEKKPSVDVGEVFTDAAQALGAKITGLFKRGPAHLDYPTSGPYDGPLASTSLAWDVEGEPLQQHVSVYHSGRSDEPMTKIVEIPTEISLEEVPVVEKPTVTAKIITGLFKKDETYLDYPAMETYEGPVDSIYRIQDVESEPIEHLVTVYHSGRSDEFVPMEEKKPSVDVGEVFTDAAQALGAKITGLFKRGPAHLDYPTSGPYDGPLASTSLAWDVEGEPLQQHVSVYHSGRSDEPMTKIVEIPTEISLEKYQW
uniref:LPXTG cell wall anchor domain-containing protein n=2 Tax=Loa loa TaxID=7209 RepID=A0A1I7VJB8_LOALO